MAYETRDNSGSLFKNDKKEAENHPDYKGAAMVDGVEMWLSAWIKTSSKGTKFMSLSFKRKEPKPEERETEFRREVDRNFGSPKEPIHPLDDSIPF